MILDIVIDHDNELYYVSHGEEYIRSFCDGLYDFIPYQIPFSFNRVVEIFSIVYENDCIGLNKIEFHSSIDTEIVFKQKWYVYVLLLSGQSFFFANFERVERFLINTDK